jgi:hypothetical protein
VEVFEGVKPYIKLLWGMLVGRQRKTEKLNTETGVLASKFSNCQGSANLAFIRVQYCTQGRRKRVGNLRQQNEMTWKLQIGCVAFNRIGEDDKRTRRDCNHHVLLAESGQEHKVGELPSGLSQESVRMLGGPSLARTLVAQKELEENEAVPSERQCKKTSVEAVVGVGSMTSGVEAGAYLAAAGGSRTLVVVGVVGSTLGVEEAACKQEPEVGTALGVGGKQVGVHNCCSSLGQKLWLGA